MEKLKHIQLFENFDSPVVNEASVNLDQGVFQWMPFDNYKGNITFDDTNLAGLTEIANESEAKGNAAEIGDAGLFMCHLPLNNGGFIRIITEKDKSISPLEFNVTTWDGNYKLTSEDKEVPLEDLSGYIVKGNVSSRFF
jgi:hypothetical protein